MGKRNEYLKAWRTANREKRRQQAIAYRLKNHEKLKSYGRWYYHNNPKGKKQRTPEQRARKNYLQRLRRNNGKETNPRAIRDKAIRWRGNPSKYLRSKLYYSQRGLCPICGIELRLTKTHMDHIIPVSKGGSNLDYNFQLLCARCNLTKGNQLLCP